MTQSDEQVTPLLLPTEVRAELVTLLRETVHAALARTKSGRSSMPIYVDDALALVVLACRAAGINVAELIEEATDV